MGFGHKANLARRWPPGRLSAPARATEGNALGKAGTNAHKTDGKGIRNSLEGAAEGEWGQTGLKLMAIGDQSAPICQVDWQQHCPCEHTPTRRGGVINPFESLVLQRQSRAKPTPRKQGIQVRILVVQLTDSSNP